MDQQLLQRTRYLLQSHFRRIRKAKRGHFELICFQVLNWLESHPILNSVILGLDNISGDHHQEIQSMIDAQKLNGSRYYQLSVRRSPKQPHEPDFKGYTPKTYEEHASACLQILRASIKKPDVAFYCLLAVYLTQEDYDPYNNNEQAVISVLQDIAVHDLYEYIDERLDSINAVNGLLRKYKQNAEWFQKHKLREVIEKGYEGKTGEKALALHLQQYVFDQGVEFIVEPSSASGEVDLLLRDASGQYTIIDAKYIKPGSSSSEITRKIAEGLNQVARYCEDYNQSEGFLAVFVNDDISILLELEENVGFRYTKIGSHVIYYIEINISERASASKSGKTKQINITQEQLIDKINEIASENPN